MHKKIITIAGRPGSGKSTASKAIAAELGYEHFSSGDLMRALGKERGIDIHDTNILAETESILDHLVDQRLRDIGKTQDQVVIDSRLAWHWIPDSFKVYLNLDLEVAAKRILANIEPERLANEHIPADPKAYGKRLQSRLASEGRRYEKLYQVNPNHLDEYDLVVDTEKNNADQVFAIILSAYQEWLNTA